MDKAEKQADQFDKVYQEAKTYLDKEINKIFDKFQRDYGLSQVDARQVLKNMKDKKDLTGILIQEQKDLPTDIHCSFKT